MKEPKNRKPLQKARAQSRFLFEELEPRLLLSADLPVDLGVDFARLEEPLARSLLSQLEVPDTGALQTPAHAEPVSEVRRELVFVDSNTPDYRQLLDDLLSNQDETRRFEVILLDNESDGISQITKALGNADDLDAVHIISHGTDGAVYLGNSALNFDALLANTTIIQAWSSAFAESGDLFIYGCNLAASEEGQSLVDALSRLTGADVAASDDLTGSAERGGDWDLEYRTGTLESSAVLSAALQQNYQGLLITGTVSGVAFADEGITDIGSGKTISLLVNGVNVESVVTGVGGAYSFTSGVSTGDAVALFIDDDATYKGVTVTVSDGTDLSDVQILADHIVIRNDNGGVTSNTDLANALGGSPDLDIHYAVVGGTLIANGVGDEVLVPTGHIFTPGGDVSASNIKILGTVNGGSNTFSIAGDWNSTAGTWNADTSTVNLIGTGILLQNTSATPWNHGFNNLSVAAAGQTTTISSVVWTNQLTTGTGVLSDAASSHALYLQGTGDVFIDGGGTLDFDALHYRVNNASQNVVARDYTGVSELHFNAVGGLAGSGIYEMQGNIIANDVHIVINNDGAAGDARTAVLNTNNFDITAANLYVGVDGRIDQYAVFNAGSSTVDISGDVIVYATDANGTSAINAATSSWTVSGHWINQDTFTAGVSTVVLDGTGTLNSGGNAFSNLTVGLASQVTTLTSDLTVSKVLTIADSTGVLTDNSGGYDITVTGTGTPFINNGAAVTARNFIYRFPSDATITAAGGTYNVAESLWIAGSGTGSGTTYRLNGDLLVTGDLHVYATSFGVSILDTLNHSITADSLQISNSSFQVGFLYANNSIIDINGDVDFVNSVTTSVSLGGSSWFVSGDWTNNSNTFNAGTSTVNFDGGIQTISGSTAFYNFTKIEFTNDATDSTLIFDNTATQTINGTLTLDGLDTDDRINLISDSPANQWSINLTASAAKGTMDYLDVADSDASGSDVSHKLINPSNTFNSGNNIDWFTNSAPTIGGTVVGQTVNDNAIIQPFNSVVIGDNDVIETLTVTVTLDVAAKGLFSTLNGFTDSGGGVYTFSGTAAAATSAIQGLAFNPTDNRVVLGATEMTTITISVDDGIAAPTTDATTTVVSTSMNDAPLLSGANDLATISEDPTSNPGTLVSDLISGRVTDPDIGPLTGIAVIGVDNANGSWEFSTNGGSSWTSFGTPASSAARLLSADASTLVRFVPNADFNGTVTGGISFHAWDQTIGLNGDVVDISGTDTVLDGFDAVSYSNNDGTQNWTTDWIESDNNGNGAIGGFIYVDGGSLQLNVVAGNSGNNIYREIDLSVATTATLNFDYQNLLIGEDEILLQVSGNGGSSYTTVMTFSGTQNAGSNSASIDVSSYIASDTRVRFYVFKNDAGADLLIDNVEVAYDNATTAPGGESAFSSGSQSSDIDVSPVNDAPVAVNDSYNINEGSGGFLPPMGVLLNDSDIDSGSLTTIQLSNVTYGTLTLNSNGSFWYSPDPNYYGSDSFTYKVNDGSLDSNIATVTLNIAPRNDAPTGSDSTVTMLEDTDYVFSSTDFGFIDPVEGDALLAVKITTLPVAGTLTLLGSGAVSAGDFISKTDIDASKLIFTPAADANGTGYASFAFQVQDDGGTANGGVNLDQSANTLTIDVIAVNDAPTVVATTSDVGTEDTVQVYTHAEMLALVGAADIDDVDTNLSVAISNVLNGTVALSGGTGGVGTTFTFTPTANFVGNMTFDYEVNDDELPTPATSAIGTATVGLGAVNDAPTTSGITNITVNEDTLVTFLNLQSAFADTENAASALVYTITNNTNPSLFAAISLSTTGALNMGYATNQNGSADITVRATDTGGLYVESTFIVTVNPINDAPTVSVTASDTGLEDTTQLYSHTELLALIGAGDVDDNDANLSVLISNVVNGTVVLSGGTGDAGTTFAFTPTMNYVGNMTFDYQVSDNDAVTSAIGTATVTLGPVNDTPIHSVPVAQFTTANSALTFSSLDGNSISVSDPDGTGTMLEVTLTASTGTISLADTAGLTFRVGSGSSDTTMIFSGTANMINAALDGMYYQADSSYQGVARLTIITGDLGNTGLGGALTARDVVEITVSNSALLLAIDEMIDELVDFPVEITVDPYVLQKAVDASSLTESNVNETPGTTADAETSVSETASSEAVPTSINDLRGNDSASLRVLAAMEVKSFDSTGSKPTAAQLVQRAVQMALVDPLMAAKTLMPLQPGAPIWNIIDSMMFQMDNDGRSSSLDQDITVTTTTGLTLTLTAGYVSWLLRAGYISASLLSFTPLWREFDPLPILNTMAEQPDIGKNGEPVSDETDPDMDDMFTQSDHRAANRAWS